MLIPMHTLLQYSKLIAPVALLVCGTGIFNPVLAASWSVTLIEQDGAPDLERNRLERAYLGHPGGSAKAAFLLALEDAQYDFESSKTTVELRTEAVSSLDAARTSALRAEKSGAQALVVTLPAAWTAAVAAAVKIPVLNVGAREDTLRGKDCAANLFHAIPSERMRADALAQALASRKWSNILLLTGPSAPDAERSAVVQASMRRYGLKAVAERPFKISSDPRERQLANPLLLTAGNNYDAVWVVDSDGEFARSLPYATAAARPVVGDAGLVALAWHGQFERFGAPQLSRRFFKTAKRPMVDQDWAAWLAGRAVASAISSTVTNLTKADAVALKEGLAKASIDGSKGVSLQFRPWDRQLRQPLLLSDGQGVVAMAPVDGILHPRNVLDTLGADEAEKQCQAKQ